MIFYGKFYSVCSYSVYVALFKKMDWIVHWGSTVYLPCKLCQTMYIALTNSTWNNGYLYFLAAKQTALLPVIIHI